MKRGKKGNLQHKRGKIAYLLLIVVNSRKKNSIYVPLCPGIHGARHPGAEGVQQGGRQYWSGGPEQVKPHNSRH